MIYDLAQWLPLQAKWYLWNISGDCRAKSQNQSLEIGKSTVGLVHALMNLNKYAAAEIEYHFQILDIDLIFWLPYSPD